MLVDAPFKLVFSPLLWKIMLYILYKENMEIVSPCHVNSTCVDYKPIFWMNRIKSHIFYLQSIL